MTVYPTQIDDDRTIIRVDDNISELGTTAIDQLREAVFSIEKTIGTNPQGSQSTLDARISVLISPDGSPKSAALEAIGLVTIPIHNNQVASNAGIEESKLNLSYTTSILNTRLSAVESQINNLSILSSTNETNLQIHIAGSVLLSDNATLARHVASHIDLNAVPIDSRDTYAWTGLLNTNGVLRSATQVAAALLEINNELVGHENAVLNTHPATSITVDASNFLELPSTLETVQETFNYIDQRETISTGLDRATLNSNGIPRASRSQDLTIDGYNINVVPATIVAAYLAEPDQNSPNDSIINGDDIISFLPEDNSDYSFDVKFANVKIGDIVRINYGNGIEAEFPIKSIRFIPGSEWVVRINTFNLTHIEDGYTAYARIDRARFDIHTWGVFAAAGVYPNVTPDTSCVNAYDSVILGNPRGAVAVGLGFDPNKLDRNHNLLYLRLYPDGIIENYVDLPAIDVTGNLGGTPGKYNIDRVVEETNKQFRSAGYNYRFIAFNQKGEFGLMLADHYNGAAFTIISGVVDGTTITQGIYERNVVADATDGYDALGFGGYRSGFATPVAPSGYISGQAAASFPTLIISPVRDRNVLINGTRRDTLATQRYTDGDGYWNAEVTNVTTSIVYGTKLVEYTIDLYLNAEEIKPGKTIVVLPEDESESSIVGYGRFIIGDVSYSAPCAGICQTTISVINGVHGNEDALGPTSSIGDNVKIYLTEDSVPLNIINIVGDSNDYHRYNEIFVNNIGESFAVERARMVKQSQSGNLLDTNSESWRIRKVSSKIKGYRTGAEFRYFTRFMISNYNQTTGEFDGYIGEPVGTNGIINTGPLTRGKKDNPVRFYDNTFVNFIDIEFREDGTDPGTIIMPSDGISRFVDIELFSTLKEHDEYFAVAGVSHDEQRLLSITDLREFGTLSEVNFTDSAIKFIEAGERYLHTNGVVRGFKYEGTGITQSVFEFTGGVALVNGTFVALDSYDVKIPEIKPLGTSTVEYFICVTETGQLKAVLKDIGEQFFERTNEYFVETLSFKEIVDNRKDLTIIATVSAIISNIDGSITYTLLGVKDARRFITNQDVDIFSWVNAEEEDGYNASFITPDALMNWVNEYGVSEVHVKYVHTNAYINLSFNNPVTLIGGTYEFTNSIGLSFTSGNWKIENANIVYYPIITPIANELFYVNNTRAGAIVIDNQSTNINDISIVNSKFWCGEEQRFPFVAFYGSSQTFDNICLSNNRFNDNLAIYGLSYAFINISFTSTNAPSFNNVLIEKNIVNGKQGLLLSGRASPDIGTNGQYIAISRISVDNFVIKDNKFGSINTLVEGNGLKIIDNESEVILSGITATLHPTSLTYGLGINSTHGYSVDQKIKNNKSSYLKAESTPGVSQNKTHISGNTIIKNSDDLIDKLIPLDLTSIYGTNANKWAITIVTNALDVSNVVCSNNIIDGLDSGYVYNIYSMGGCTITGNIINHIATGGYGIWNSCFHPDQPTTITGNSLNKNDNTIIESFIFASSDAAVYGNNLSHFNLNYQGVGDGYDGYDGYSEVSTFSADFSGISGASYAAYNVNQVVAASIDLTCATPLFNHSPVVTTAITQEENNRIDTWVQTTNVGLDRVFYNQNTGSWIWNWTGASVSQNDGTVGLIFPIDAIIPPQAHLLSFSAVINLTCPWAAYLSGSSFNVFPALTLEVGGTEYVISNIGGGGVFNPVYRSSALLYNERPTNPRTGRRDVILRIKQGVGPIPPSYAAWVGPTVPGTLTISKPIITWLY